MKKTENKSGKSGMQVMKKLMAFIGNYKIFLGLSIVLAAVTVILQLYIPILFGDAIDEVVAAHQVNFPEMWFYLKRIVFFTLVSALSAWIMNLINNRMTYRIVRDLRSQAIRHIQVLPLSYLDQHSSGDIVSRVIADTDILSDGLLLGFTQMFSGIVTIIVTLFFMFSKNVWITLLVICLTPLSFFVAKFISGRSFTGFAFTSPCGQKGYLLLFRENVPESAFTFTRMPQKARLRLLCANGPVGQGYTPAGDLCLRFAAPRTYAFYQWQT